MSRTDSYTMVGFVTYDTIFSMLVIAVMLFEIMFVVNATIHKVDTYKHKQRVLNNLVIVGDYVVNHCVKKTGASSEDVSYPGQIDVAQLGVCTFGLKERFGFNHLNVGLTKSTGAEDCIYRIVLIGDEPRMLYVCGD